MRRRERCSLLGPLNTGLRACAVIYLTIGTGAAQERVESQRSWRARLDRIAAVRGQLGQALDRLHRDLRARVEAERPDLLPKLDPEAPKARPSGYGLLPELVPDDPEAGELAPVETRYSLSALDDWLTHECGAAAELAASMQVSLASLDSVVEGYRVRAENLRRIEEHVGYHALWQPEAHRIAASPDTARWLACYRAWRTRPEDPDLRRQVEESFLDFTPRPGLMLAPTAEGWRTLRVPIASDIEDQEFLAAFEQGVERVWNDSDAMNAGRLRLDITLAHRRSVDLYPEGPPSRGAKVDQDRHLERFPAETLVLTTGGSSTHVWGRGILLGGGRTTCRTLAHEFAHLIGFADRYRRVVDGIPEGPSGATFLEIVPFPADLMSSPGLGRVTPWMVRKITQAYGESGAPAVQKGSWLRRRKQDSVPCIRAALVPGLG